MWKYNERNIYANNFLKGREKDNYRFYRRKIAAFQICSFFIWNLYSKQYKHLFLKQNCLNKKYLLILIELLILIFVIIYFESVHFGMKVKWKCSRAFTVQEHFRWRKEMQCKCVAYDTKNSRLSNALRTAHAGLLLLSITLSVPGNAIARSFLRGPGTPRKMRSAGLHPDETIRMAW